jgi:hypothetical protein
VITKVAGVRLEAAAMEAAVASEPAVSVEAATSKAASVEAAAAAPYKAAAKPAAASASAMAAASAATAATAATGIGANGRQGQSADHEKSGKRSFDRCTHHNLPFLFTNTATAQTKLILLRSRSVCWQINSPRCRLRKVIDCKTKV